MQTVTTECNCITYESHTHTEGGLGRKELTCVHLENSALTGCYLLTTNRTVHKHCHLICKFVSHRHVSKEF